MNYVEHFNFDIFSFKTMSRFYVNDLKYVMQISMSGVSGHLDCQRNYFSIFWIMGIATTPRISW